MLKSLIRDDRGRKRCTKCAQWLPEDQFWAKQARKDGLQSSCKNCYVPSTRGKRSSDRRRRERYQLTPSAIDELFARQSGACAICKTPVDKVTAHVDHDHKCCPGAFSCGKCVRGLLCRSCNLGLGFLADDVQTLQNAIEYLTDK